MEPAYKHCRECGAEFQHWVSRCLECNGSLDWIPETPLGVDPAESLPPARELVCLHVEDHASHAREIAQALRAGGVPCRVDSYPADAPLDARPDGRAPRLGVYVRERDGEAASEITSALLARRSPEVAEMGEVEEPDENVCPACGGALDPAAASCTACGLSFPSA